MNNILNLNQEPKQIAEDAKLSFYPLLKTPYPSQYPKMAIELAINLIQNMQYVCIKTWNGVESADYTKLSEF